jgi:2-amino-4-hydroxy-6-hydroxymethyldihydropteridine diphosphokinase
MSIVYIGIGSNLGNREHNCRRAIELLGQRGVRVRKRSSLYETEPWGVKDQPRFLNMVIEIETELNPQELLEVLKNAETEVGRQKTFTWGPRIIDLDILFYNDLIVNEDNLKIPHPFMHERDFVLRPLVEIAPELRHPLLKMSVRELFNRLDGRESDSHGTSRY